jgi:uncharacterized damage-inducible protein DinB
MKAYFIKLFNYDQFENHAILETIIAGGNTQKPMQLMAHLLAAQQVWLSRCCGEPVFNGVLWPDWTDTQLKQTIDEKHNNWINYLNTLKPDDFEKIIPYKSLAGVAYDNKLVDILTHVINHGTHHRAQAGQQLKFAGIESLPPTDYIFYVRK